MMQLIVQVLSLIGIYIAIGVFSAKTEYNFQFDEEVPCVRMHIGYAIVGIGCTIICAVFSIVECVDGNEGLSALFFFLGALSSLLFLAYYGFRITFDKEKIVYRRFFESPKTIYYKEIVEVRVGLDLLIRTKNQKLVIPNYMTNVPALLLKMMPYMPKRKKVKEVPRVKAFSDSVERPMEFIIMFAVLEIFVTSVGLCVMIYSKFDAASILAFSVVWFITTGMIFLCVHSAKRAHSSSFWNKVAHVMFKSGYLRD